jgi:CBS-domain-containing membrane protein
MALEARVRPHRLTVEDVMSRDVATVPPSATFHEMIGVMDQRGVSALPVVGDRGEVLGIVSEADLLPKESPISRRGRWLPEGADSTAWRRRAEGNAAVDVDSFLGFSLDDRHLPASRELRVS